MEIQNTYKDMVEIGSGGGGTVFRAYHTRMDKYVVLKKIHDGLQGKVDIRSELDILKNLRHSFLPSVLDFIEENGSIYTVMDYIEGESFESYLSQGKRFNQTQVIKYARQIGEVLTYLHSQNPPIVHGDIKPANIMLTPEDNICLIDFNISQVKSGASGFNMGYTPGYAAPEQVELVEKIKRELVSPENEVQNNSVNYTVLLDDRGKTVLLDEANEKTVLLDMQTEEKVDERSDIYSVGATLYALLWGNAPDEGLGNAELDCSAGLAYLIETCLEAAPQKRFQSAVQFLKAVDGIAKADKRYKHLVFRQNAAILLCIGGIAGSIILSEVGYERIGAEQVASYNVLVSEMEELRIEGGDEQEFEEVYAAAQEMFPDYAGAYYQKTLFLYQHREYSEMIRFISDEILSHDSEFSAEEKSNFYFLLANGYLETDDLDTALTYYKTAVGYNPYDSTYYADYAIALARNDRLQEAEEILSEAVNKGMSNDKILLARGEINGRQGMTDTAATCFRECIEETADPYVLLRAYVMWGKLYDFEESDEESLLQKAAVLEKGKSDVNTEYCAVILEQLAQVYIDLGSLMGEKGYRESAIAQLEEIVNLGWDTYVTHNNIGILYEVIGEYDLARQEFTEMLTVYGQDYRIYKRLAFLEIDIQAAKDNKDRNYGQFLEYYQTSSTLFHESGIQADTDMEMQLLDQAYDQLKEGNWF